MSGDSTDRREESSITESDQGETGHDSPSTSRSRGQSLVQVSSPSPSGKESLVGSNSTPSGKESSIGSNSTSSGKESSIGSNSTSSGKESSIGSDLTSSGRPVDPSVESKSCHSTSQQRSSDTGSFWSNDTESIKGPGRAVMKLSRTSSQPVHNVSSGSIVSSVSIVSSGSIVSSVSSAMNSHRRNNSSTYEGFKSATDEDWNPDLVLDNLSISNPGAYTGISRPSGQSLSGQSPSGHGESNQRSDLNQRSDSNQRSESNQRSDLNQRSESNQSNQRSESNQSDRSPSDPNPQPILGRIVIGPGHPHPVSILPSSVVSSGPSKSSSGLSSVKSSSGLSKSSSGLSSVNPSSGQSKSASSQAQRFISGGQSKPMGDNQSNNHHHAGANHHTSANHHAGANRHTSANHHAGAVAPSDPKVAKLKKLILEDEVPDMNQVRSLAWSGIPSEVRPVAWKLLMGYIPLVKSKRTLVLERKRSEYHHLVHSYYNNKSTNDDMWRQIHIDIPRMQPLISIFQQEVVQKIFERILYIWSIRHPASGYVQGMNDLVTPFFVTYLSEFIPGHSLSDVESFEVSSLPDPILRGVEADSFWSFTKLLDSIQDNYTFAQPGIQRLVNLLSRVMSRVDVNLHDHLMRNSVQYLQFSFRWMNNLLIRELPLRCIVRLWDTYLAEGAAVSSSLVANHWSSSCLNSSDGTTETASSSPTLQSVANDSWTSSGHGTPFSSSFHLFVCAAFLRFWSKSLLKEQDFQGLMLLLQNLPTFHWTENEIKLMVADAYQLKCTFTPSHLNS